MLEMQMGRVKKVSCALCGKVVWALPTDQDVPTEHEGGDKWNPPKFLKNVVAAGSSTSVGASVSPSPTRFNRRAMVRPLSPPPPTSLQTVIPVFRILTSPSSTTSYTSSSYTSTASGTPTTPQNQLRSAPYPLCANGWCQKRLCRTVELWKFLRERVVERIWEDETRSEMIIAHQLSQEQGDIPPLKVNVNTTAESMPAPPVPPRKKLAGLWGVISGSASPANDTSPTSSDTPYGTGVASRGINIGGLASGLGGFLGRKNSTPNVKLGSSRESSPSPGPPALPPRNIRSATVFLGAGVSKVQDTEKAEGKGKEALGVPVEEEKPDTEKVEQIVQAEEERPPLVEEVKLEPPSIGSAPLMRSPSDQTDVVSPGDFATPSESVAVPPHAETLAEKLDVVKAELEMEVVTESA